MRSTPAATPRTGSAPDSLERRRAVLRGVAARVAPVLAAEHVLALPAYGALLGLLNLSASFAAAIARLARFARR